MKQYYKVDQIKQEDLKRMFVHYWDEDLRIHMKNTARTVSKIKNLRFLGLTGPTCSGKTTAARLFTDYLERHGRRVHVISLDDFYYEKEYLEERANTDPNIEIDYDSEETIDNDLLAQKIASLMANQTTELPRFDFPSGRRMKGSVITPSPDDVFLVEGIQVLYPKVDAILRAATYKSIYICAFSGIEIGDSYFEPNEIRFMRRLVRDYHFRASNPEFTYFLWQSVRENEEKTIFPNAHRCDYFIDSTMPYEIGMLKPYLLDIIDKMDPQNKYYAQAKALLAKVDDVLTVSHTFISPNSLYKEFI